MKSTATFAACLPAAAIVACMPATRAATLAKVADPPRPSPRSAAVVNLAAMPARDLDALLATVAEGDKRVFILPDGENPDPRRRYVAFRGQWFADDGCTFEAEIVGLPGPAGSGHALVRYRSEATDPGGSPRGDAGWLALAIESKQGQWRLASTRAPASRHRNRTQ